MKNCFCCTSVLLGICMDSQKPQVAGMDVFSASVLFCVVQFGLFAYGLSSLVSRFSLPQVKSKTMICPVSAWCHLCDTFGALSLVDENQSF